MMSFSKTLERVVAILQEKHIRFALAGGLVASIYRSEERVTKDLDLLFLAKHDSVNSARETLVSLGLQPHPVRKAALEGGPLHARKRATTPIWIMKGICTNSEQVPVDFLLTTIPWVTGALDRAESNLIDFGFAKLPCITCEDVIISKLFAVLNRSDRFKDLDDLQNIFRNRKGSLDLNYLCDQMAQLKLVIPRELRADAPAVLSKASKIQN